MLSDPTYGNPPKDTVGLASEVPKGWAVVDATAFLLEPKDT